MKYPDRFNNAINKLVKAFFDETLTKGKCTACAVGNICDGSKDWSSLFVTIPDTGVQYVANDGEIVVRHMLLGTFTSLIQNNFIGESVAQHRYDKANEIINKTGYSKHELARVENAFETAEEVDGPYSLQSQFNGLMVVVDVLCDIEGINDPEPFKDLFKPKLELVCIINHITTNLIRGTIQ
jgi:hypothetical protein